MKPTPLLPLLRRIYVLVPLALVAATILIFLPACTTEEKPTTVIIRADGKDISLATTAMTVNQALKEAGVSVGPLDRLSPPVWTEITDGLVIAITRVTEEFYTQTQSLPYSRKIIHDEALDAGESRLIQAGAEGVEEFTYRILYEDGVEVSRSLSKRTTAKAPVDEILIVGAKGNLDAVDFSGTLAYLSRGNAWVMRENSSGRRPLTSEGDLDQHVFSLSPDSRRLLFSRAAPADDADTLNSLWMVTTTVKGDAPFPLGIENVLWAEWSPKGDAIAYSTAEVSPGAPGWKAHNDIWIAHAPAFTPTQVLSPTANMVYSWWGTKYAWSPAGDTLAYAAAGEIGLVDLSEATRRTLIQFPPFDSHSAWVWTPGISWSPDGEFLAAIVHRHSGVGTPEESPLFDLWVLSVDGTMVVPLARDVGMWSTPRWSPPKAGTPKPESAILFGIAEYPSHSQLSLYDLYIMDRDGSNRQKVFPPETEKGAETVDAAWSPEGDALVIVLHGDLYLVHPDTGEVQQLTADGGSSVPRWGP